MGQPGRAILRTLSDDARTTLLDHLARHVDKASSPDGCWLWTKALVNGYGVAWTRMADGSRRMVKMHRVAYEAATGDDAADTIDHICHDHRACPNAVGCSHRRCVRPDHLSAASIGDNIGRSQAGRLKTVCSYGHVLADENVYVSPKGDRQCRACQRRRDAKRRKSGPVGPTSRCKRGHAFTPENTYVDSRGANNCKACQRARQLEHQYKLRQGKPDGRFRENGVCANGHDTSVLGVSKRGACMECARERNRRYAETRRQQQSA